MDLMSLGVELENTVPGLVGWRMLKWLPPVFFTM
jgi:hypothetical protein